MVDSLGLVLKAFVTQADCQDGAVASWLVPLLPDKFPLPLEAVGRWWLHWRLARQTAEDFPIDIEIVHRQPGQRGFKVIPWPWLVERTFAWLNQYRRLSKDYEYLVSTADAMLYAAMLRLMLRRLSPC